MATWDAACRPFEKATGYPKEELIGGDPNVISSKKYTREFWAKVWNTISAGKVWTGEIENRRKDGRPILTQLLISPILNNDGIVVGYLGSHRDVTEQRALEQQLMHSQKMESIGTLAAGIAHEVGNPLASISSVVQVLMRTVDDQFARDKLGLVQSQVHRITKIIRDLVDFSRPSNYEVRTTDVVKVLTDVVGISHVISVRVVADTAFRIQAAQRQQNLSRKDALAYIAKADTERRDWTRFLFEAEWEDPHLYDLVLNLTRMSLNAACETVPS